MNKKQLVHQTNAHWVFLLITYCINLPLINFVQFPHMQQQFSV